MPATPAAVWQAAQKAQARSKRPSDHGALAPPFSEKTSMYAFRLSGAGQRRGRRRRPRQGRRQAARRRPDAAADHEAAPRRAVACSSTCARSRASPAFRARATRIVIGAHDPPRRRRRQPRRPRRDPGPRRARRPDRRPRRAPSRHDRRLARQQRPRRRLSRRRAGARRDHRHQQARDQGRRLLQGPVRDGAGGRTRSSPR